jgi:signal peptide peptidase-like protein 2B
MGLRDRIAFTTETLELGDVSYVQLLAAIASYGLGAVWTYISFTQRHPDAILFFWVMQDIMGACMCILFLATMKLNSIKVASILLTAAFFYDIFFVFVTPLLTKGGKSIMVDVATSGGK